MTTASIGLIQRPLLELIHNSILATTYLIRPTLYRDNRLQADLDMGRDGPAGQERERIEWHLDWPRSLLTAPFPVRDGWGVNWTT